MSENNNELQPVPVNIESMGGPSIPDEAIVHTPDQGLMPQPPVSQQATEESIEEPVKEVTPAPTKPLMSEPIDPDEDPLVASAYLGETPDGENIMIIHRETLENMLTDIMPAITSKSVRPIEEMALIHINEKQLRVEGTNGVIHIVRTCDQYEHPSKKKTPAFSYGGDVSISLCIEAKVLHATLKRLRTADIAIKHSPGKGFITLKSGRSEIQLNTLEGDLFPTQKELTGETKRFSFDTSDELQGMYKSVSYACAKNESRPILTGVFHKFEKNRLEVMATDSHRVAVSRSHEDDMKFPDSNLTAVVPESTVTSIIKLLNKREDDKVTVTMSSNAITYELDNIKVISLQLEGKFPDLDRLLPDGDLENKVNIPVSVLQDAAAFISMFDDESNKRLVIKLIPEYGQLRISSVKGERGAYTNDTVITRNPDADKLSMLSNFEYIKSALTKFTEHDEITLHYSNHLRPFLILDKRLGSDMNIDLILPIRSEDHDDNFEIEDFKGEETFNPIEQILNSISSH